MRKKYENNDKRHMPANCKNPVKSSTGSQSIKSALRKRQILAMRLRNMTLKEIGERLNMSLQQVQRYAKEAIEELPRENAEQLRAVLNNTLQDLIYKLRDAAMSGEKDSANIFIKSIDKLMKLEGLSITKQEVEVNNVKTVVGEGIDVSELDLPIEIQKQLLEAMRKRNKEIEEANGQGQTSEISN